jgi:hypothetical protein
VVVRIFSLFHLMEERAGRGGFFKMLPLSLPLVIRGKRGFTPTTSNHTSIGLATGVGVDCGAAKNQAAEI